MRQTIVPSLTRFPSRWVVPHLPFIGGPSRVMKNTSLVRDVLGRFEDRDRAQRVFVEWNEEVKRTVPADRLLVFEAKQGWEPLCEFLGVPVPDAPFPRVNDTAEFRRRVDIANAVSWMVLVTPPLAALILLRAMWTR
jgi:hypothetical protein